jgi:hypothetical protein
MDDEMRTIFRETAEVPGAKLQAGHSQTQQTRNLDWRKQSFAGAMPK